MEGNHVELSDAQLDEIASRAADKVTAHVQIEVGKSALRALSYVAWAAVAAIMAYLTAKGFIKP